MKKENKLITLARQNYTALLVFALIIFCSNSTKSLANCNLNSLSINFNYIRTNGFINSYPVTTFEDENITFWPRRRKGCHPGESKRHRKNRLRRNSR